MALCVVTVDGAALALILHGPIMGFSLLRFAVLAVLFLICDSTPAPIGATALWSPGSSVILASVVLLGPVGAALVGSIVVLMVHRNLIMPRRLFNGGMYAICGYSASWVFLHLGGHVGLPGRSSFPDIIGPFAAAAVVHVVLNHGLVRAVIWITSDPRAGAQAQQRRDVLNLMLSDLGYAAFGLLIAAMWSAVGPVSGVLVIIPLFVTRWAIGQYGAQQRAYEATMAALCKAVETKDFYTRGHSERVSKGASMLAREIGMRAARLEAITYAGMLHDVGKLGVPTKVLQKSGSLTEEEYAAIQLHPMRGLEIVREIGFLDEALAGIMHHHERIDGRGYPLGLAGDEIPEFARVIAVADAFDSMTSTRSYRGARRIEEAVAELRKWSGSQFDPALVDAFITALQRDGWDRPAPIEPPADEVSSQDHDDPTAPLRIAESR